MLFVLGTGFSLPGKNSVIVPVSAISVAIDGVNGKLFKRANSSRARPAICLVREDGYKRRLFSILALLCLTSHPARQVFIHRSEMMMTHASDVSSPCRFDATPTSHLWEAIVRRKFIAPIGEPICIHRSLASLPLIGHAP